MSASLLSVGGRRSVGRQSILLAGATGFSQLLLAVMYVLVAREIGPASYGFIIAAIALGMTFSTFLDFGSNMFWIREGASGRLDAEQLGARALSKVILSTCILGAWTAVLIVGHFGAAFLWVSGPIALASLVAQTSQMGLRRLGRVDLVAATVLVDRTVGIAVLLVLLFGLRVNATWSLWLAIVAGSAAGAIACWVLTPAGSRLRLGSGLLINPWRGSGYYGLSGVAGSIQSLELQAIALVGGPAAAGLFGAVNKWTQPLGLLSSAFAGASEPFVAAASSWKVAWRQIRHAFWLPLAAMAGGLLGAVLAPLLVPVLLGDDYTGSVGVLQLLALGTIPGVANQILAVFLQARGSDRPVSFILLFSAVAQLVLVALLVADLGAFGGALASSGSQLIAFIGLVGLALRLRSHGRTESRVT